MMRRAFQTVSNAQGSPLNLLARTCAMLPLTDTGSLPSSGDSQGGEPLTWNKATEIGQEALLV